ncbi:MAG: FecR domain-containing protein [Verrucomicrobiales bacterium]|nr:FecR domain-containing protein [Verrucomicrobiales bacterium]
MNRDKFDRVSQAWLNGELSDEEFQEFQEALRENPGFRREFIRLANLDSGLRDLAMVEEEEPEAVAFSTPRTAKAGFIALAASLALLILAVGILWQRSGREILVDAAPKTTGVAVITAEAGAVWEKEEGQVLETGVPLEPGALRLREGLAQIEFFGGASISLSGPAEIELVTRDKAILNQGRLKANVPPAARGFEIRTGDVLLEDLGTTFGLAADGDAKAELIVFDGEVVATGIDGKPLSLTDGESASFEAGVTKRQPASSVGAFAGIEEVFAGSGNRDELRYANWKEASLELRQDPRLIAYYDFENLTPISRRLRNRAVSGSELDGGIVGARVAEGRWAGKTALDFRLEGDRVRFQIPGKFEGLTIFAWVRIDALDRNLNSLFLTDYFDEHEFHWQLSRRGALHFASSPEGPRDIPQHNRRYYSDQFWDPGKSGQWFHLATTVSMGVGGVQHYVNGEPVGFSGGTQMHKALDHLRIGEADLGNWSDTLWPDVAIRTLNGRIDEFAIFQAPLTSDEIRAIYENGKP